MRRRAQLARGDAHVRQAGRDRAGRAAQVAALAARRWRRRGAPPGRRRRGRSTRAAATAAARSGGARLGLALPRRRLAARAHPARPVPGECRRAGRWAPPPSTRWPKASTSRPSGPACRVCASLRARCTRQSPAADRVRRRAVAARPATRRPSRASTQKISSSACSMCAGVDHATGSDPDQLQAHRVGARRAAQVEPLRVEVTGRAARALDVVPVRHPAHAGETIRSRHAAATAAVRSVVCGRGRRGHVHRRAEREHVERHRGRQRPARRRDRNRHAVGDAAHEAVGADPDVHRHPVLAEHGLQARLGRGARPPAAPAAPTRPPCRGR